MRSADLRLAAAAALLLPVVLGGCDSTFQQNARAKLAAARRIAAKESHTVGTRGADVRVDRVTLLREKGSTAVVVDVHSTADRILTDVPISVGVRRGSRKVLLNAAKELDYFQTHLPAVPAKGRATWVFRSPPGGRARAGDTPFVRIGVPTGRTSATSLPTVAATVTRVSGTTASVALTKAQIPQLGMPVSVVLRRGRTPVAAGTFVLDSIDRGQDVTVQVPLTGRAGKQATTQLVVVPTIFQ